MKKSILFFLAALFIGVTVVAQPKKVAADSTAKQQPDMKDYQLKVRLIIDTSVYNAIRKVIGSMPVNSGAGAVYYAISDTANVKRIMVKKSN